MKWDEMNQDEMKKDELGKMNWEPPPSSLPCIRFPLLLDNRSSTHSLATLRLLYVANSTHNTYSAWSLCIKCWSFTSAFSVFAAVAVDLSPI